MEETDPILDVQRDWMDALHIPPSPTIVDVGANIGRFAEEALERWPTAWVVCFEPQPVAASRITSRAEVRSVALGREGGTQRLFCDPGHGIAMSASFHIPWKDGIDVPVERLDEQGIHLIDLLKIDAEGSELAVMEGAGDLLRPEHIRIVQWEFNSVQVDAGVTAADFIGLLEGRGYAVGEIGPGGTVAPVADLSDVARGAHHELVAS